MSTYQRPSPVVVGVDLGGTKIAASVVDADGAEGLSIVRTPARQGPEAVLDALAQVVGAAAGDRPIGGIGIGSAGVVDPSRGVIVSSTDAITDWSGTDVAGGVSRRLGGVPVSVLNDVDAHALGEATAGAAREVRSFLMVAVGTGVGASIVINGVPHRGRRHVAAEIAHVPTPGAEGMRCSCGRDGHLEAIAAGPAIHRRFVTLGGSAPDSRAVVAAASAGNPLARQVISEAAIALGRAVAGVVTMVDPDMVVVGGGVSTAGAIWWEPFEEAVRSELIDSLAQVPVVAAALGAQAAVIGAAGSVHLR